MTGGGLDRVRSGVDRARELLPPGSRRRTAAGFGAVVARRTLASGRVLVAQAHRAAAELELGDPYRRLLAGARSTETGVVPGAARRTTNRLAVHVIVLERAGVDFAATIDSLQSQHWPHWTCSFIGSRSDLVTTLASSLGSERVVVGESFEQTVARLDARHPVVVVEAGDRLAPDALFRVSDAFWENPALRLVHWDDDIAGADPRFRPSWSPELLCSANYLGRSFALRAAGWRGRSEPLTATDWWRVLLESDLTTAAVRRIPLVLGHLRERLEECPDGGVALVQAELNRRGWPAVARRSGASVQLDWRLEPWPSVTVIIPSRFNRALLEASLSALARTDYPDVEVVVIDNSGRTDEKVEWYGSWADRLTLRVEWWTGEPFNYSAVNNHAAAMSTSDVLVFLNDDTDAVDPRWLQHLVGWATRPEVGTVGLQLIDADGMIQHGGVILGVGGFAGHLFDHMAPHQETIFGHTDWTRNVLAVTGACVAIRRRLFEDIGGFDERFVLCGSDVVLGIDAHHRGLRNVCSVGTRVDHLESATRGGYSVPADLYASWWRYQRWVSGGDPFHSPNLRLAPGVPQPQNPTDLTPAQRVGPALGRSFGVFRQTMRGAEADQFARLCRADSALVDRVSVDHAAVTGPQPVRTVNWFLPEFDNPFYGGINTALRIADHLRRHHGVENRFIVLGTTTDLWYRSAIAAAFEDLAHSPIHFVLPGDPFHGVPAADAAIATIWHSAFAVAHSPAQRRRFYLIQDFEPAFYPAGTMYALAEESYRLGLYGVCNTEPMSTMYRERYGGTGSWFLPAVDRRIFHAERPERAAGDPVRIFLYSRPGHWRNCWEIASGALEEIKARHGDAVHIVTAGSWARPDDLGRGIEHLGLLDYAETGALYRTCDIGIALTVSEHPSYLPLELMACGVAVVAFDIPEASWILRHGETGLLARRTVDGLAGEIDRLVVDAGLRQRLAAAGEAAITSRHGDWAAALGGIHRHLVDPERSPLPALADDGSGV